MHPRPQDPTPGIVRGLGRDAACVGLLSFSEGFPRSCQSD